jgi:hypothetical protein
MVGLIPRLLHIIGGHGKSVPYYHFDSSRVAKPHRFYADPDSVFHFAANPDPDPHHSDTKLQPLA